MNWLAILCAGVAYWVLGFVWYSLLFGGIWGAEQERHRRDRDFEEVAVQRGEGRRPLGAERTPRSRSEHRDRMATEEPTDTEGGARDGPASVWSVQKMWFGTSAGAASRPVSSSSSFTSVTEQPAMSSEVQYSPT